MIISLDTESTGLDWAHGARPFLVTTYDQDDLTRFWEWPVDPVSRQPEVPPGDLTDIAELMDAADTIYLHNARFDAHMLDAIGLSLPWPKVRDTMAAAHLLGSNLLKNLTYCCIEYLGEDIEHFEVQVREVTRACREIVRKHHSDWKIAEEGDEDMPSVKASSKRDEDKPWKNDMWLPRALAPHVKDCPSTWMTACSRYANSDSKHTFLLGLETDRLIRERGFWKIYQHRLELCRVYYEMECCGITARGDYTDTTCCQFEEHVAEAEAAMVGIAAECGHKLEVAKGAALNDNMRDFFYGAVRQDCVYCGYSKRVKHWNDEVALPTDVCPKCAGKKRGPTNRTLQLSRHANLALPPIHNGKSKGPSLDKDVMQEYLTTLEEGPALDFIELLSDKRRHDTDLGYMESYRRFWVPVQGAPGYYRIHPSLNPFGTDHLRASSNSPNMQNVSVQEEKCERCKGVGCAVCGWVGKSRLSVRRCFGPAPGREWWDFDFRNLEKRVPVYECGEESLIEVFEKPDDPPYWGSDHNVLASLLFPDEYWPLAQVRDGFKKDHHVKYKRVKNTNFAKQYGAGKRKVDATAGVRDAYEKIERGLPKIAKLQAHYLALAEKDGLVYTLPDRTVDPTRGYPILAGRTEEGRVLSTTPFNYHVSGTACWIKNMGLVRCSVQCAEWRAIGFDARIPLEVHDSILFDFPRGKTMEENLPRALVLRGLMERGGPDLIPSIPTPVSISYHTESWESGVSV